MKQKHDKRAIMRHAHAIRRETHQDFSQCLRLAWAQARTSRVPVTRELIMPPLVQAAFGVAHIARRLTRSRIEIAARVHVDIGVRVTPRDEAPIAYVLSKQGAMGVEYDNRGN